MNLLELSIKIKNKINVDLFDFALSDIINFDTMIGTVANKSGDEFITFNVITPKKNISYYVENYLDENCDNCIEDLEIKVQEL